MIYRGGKLDAAYEVEVPKGGEPIKGGKHGGVVGSADWYWQQAQKQQTKDGLKVSIKDAPYGPTVTAKLNNPIPLKDGRIIKELPTTIHASAARKSRGGLYEIGNWGCVTMKYRNEGLDFQRDLNSIYKINLPDPGRKHSNIVTPNKGDRIFVGGFN